MDPDPVLRDFQIPNDRLSKNTIMFDLAKMQTSFQSRKNTKSQFIHAPYFSAVSESRTDINRMRIKYVHLRQVPNKTFFTLDPTQLDPPKTENFVTRPDTGLLFFTL